MDTERFEMTPHVISGVAYMTAIALHREGTTDNYIVQEFVRKAICKAQVAKVFSMLEPIELEALGDEERMDVDIPCETCDKKPNWASLTTECMDCVAKCFIQATIRHNQAKGQLYRLKEG